MKRKLIFSGIICLLSFLSFSCYHDTDKGDKEKTIYTDVEFVQGNFPKIQDIESVKYYYHDMSSGRSEGIGPTPYEFSGLIYIGEEFAGFINDHYVWESCEVDANPDILENIKFEFMYSDDFEEEYIDSLIGYIFFDKERKVLYFRGGY
jgi:hypothetical protein